MVTQEHVEKRCLELYGYVPDGFEPMLRHHPGVIDEYLDMRSEAMKEPPAGSLTSRERYLILLAIEISNGKVPENHLRGFVQDGGRAAEVAELVAICICLCGMMTNQLTGNRAIRIAEDEEESA